MKQIASTERRHRKSHDLQYPRGRCRCGIQIMHFGCDESDSRIRFATEIYPTVLDDSEKLVSPATFIYED